MFELLINAIKTHDTIIIHRHAQPDGDAIGSQIGLKHAILENLPHKIVYTVGDEPGFFDFLSGSQMDSIPDEVYHGALAIILDCGSRHMISDKRYMFAKTTVRVDHHILNEKIADYEIIDTSFESCCGMIASLIVESGWKLNPLCATALYTGMVTDSGRFRYDGTNSRTFRLASMLIEQPIDTNQLFRNLYADSFESKKLKASFVLKIQFTPKNVAYIYTTQEELQDLGMDTFTISRGMVNAMADIKGVDIWVNFTETENGVLSELRSNKYNINPIAVKYGGGGHAKASGATVADRKTAMVMLEDLDKLIGETP